MSLIYLQMYCIAIPDPESKLDMTTLMLLSSDKTPKVNTRYLRILYISILFSVLQYFKGYLLHWYFF